MKTFLGKDLKEMLLADENSLPIYSPSEHWKKLNWEHADFLVKNGGLKNFKRTVNLKYFNWTLSGIIFHQLSPLVSVILSRHLDFLNAANYGRGHLLKTKSLGDRFFNIIYSRYVAVLYEYIENLDDLRIFDKISEPLLGNPLLVEYKKKLLSQDLCNSVYEFYSIIDYLELSKVKNILEIGAGYGRLAYVFLKIDPRVKYYIIDFAPALYIAQKYLKQVFPSRKIFKFQNFTSYSSVKKSIEKADVVFLMPYQIGLLPDKMFDLTINISSLHEMTTKQIKHYFKQINRLTCGYFYSKQWKRSIVKDNNFIKMGRYPTPKLWKKIYCRTHPIQKMFFDSLYSIR